MKIAVTADWHVDRVTGRLDRWPEIVRFMDWFVEKCADFKPDLVCHLGDWADPGSDELRDQVRIAQSVSRLREAGKFALIPGNHDVVLGTERLSVLTPIEVWASDTSDVIVSTIPEVVVKDERVVVVSAPYPSDTRDFMMGLSFPGWDRLENPDHSEYLARLDDSTRTDKKLIIILSHLMLAVCEKGVESDEMLRGEDCFIPEWLLDRAAVVLQGHYHRRQSHHLVNISSKRDCRVFVPGSPIRHTFSEETDKFKGAWFLDV